MATGIALPVGGAVHSRNRLHRNRFGAVDSRNLEAFEWLESHGRRAEPVRAARMGQHQRRGERHLSALVVEIVRMLVMADQHHVDGSQRGGGYRRADRLGQVVVFTGLVERRIHQDPTAAEVDNGGRTAQHTERDVAASGAYSATHDMDSRCPNSPLWGRGPL